LGPDDQAARRDIFGFGLDDPARPVEFDTAPADQALVAATASVRHHRKLTLSRSCGSRLLVQAFQEYLKGPEASKEQPMTIAIESSSPVLDRLAGVSDRRGARALGDRLAELSRWVRND